MTEPTKVLYIVQGKTEPAKVLYIGQVKREPTKVLYLGHVIGHDHSCITELNESGAFYLCFAMGLNTLK